MINNALTANELKKRLAIAERLEFIRIKKLKLKKVEFVRLFEITYQHYNNILNGRSFLSTDKYINFADKTNISLDFILLGKSCNNARLNAILSYLDDEEMEKVHAILENAVSLAKHKTG